jgi:hypothetical protein
MRVLQEGGSYVTVVTNGTAEPRPCRLRRAHALAPQLLWGAPSTLARGDATLALGARQTAVLLWK